MFNFIDIYIFIPVSSFVGRGPCALFFPGAKNAIKTALGKFIADCVGWLNIWSLM